MGKVMTLDVAIFFQLWPEMTLKWHVLSEMVPMSDLKVTHFFAKLCFCVLIKLFCCGGMMRDSCNGFGLRRRACYVSFPLKLYRATVNNVRLRDEGNGRKETFLWPRKVSLRRFRRWPCLKNWKFMHGWSWYRLRVASTVYTWSAQSFLY